MSTDLTSQTSGGESSSHEPNGDSDSTIEFRRLSVGCNRGAFSCGEREIDKWFKKDALKQHDKFVRRVTTAHLIGNNAPVGFYALTVRMEADSELQRSSGRSILTADRGMFVSVQLCYVAVQKSMQRRGVGTIILGKALDDFYEIAIRTGIFALTLVAINRDVVQFYEKLGFVSYGSGASQPKMFLPSRSVIEMREAAATTP